MPPKRFVSILAIIALAGCMRGESPAQANARRRAEATDAMAKINDANHRLVTAFAAGQADSVAAIYTPDAHVMPPNAPEAVGTKAIRDMTAGEMAQGSWTLTLATKQLSGMDSTVIERGRYVMDFKPGPKASGMFKAAFADTGKYLVVWRAQPDGRWLIADDIYNSDLPLTPRP